MNNLYLDAVERNAADEHFKSFRTLRRVGDFLGHGILFGNFRGFVFIILTHVWGLILLHDESGDLVLALLKESMLRGDLTV